MGADHDEVRALAAGDADDHLRGRALHEGARRRDPGALGLAHGGGEPALGVPPRPGLELEPARGQVVADEGRGRRHDVQDDEPRSIAARKIERRGERRARRGREIRRDDDLAHGPSPGCPAVAHLSEPR